MNGRRLTIGAIGLGLLLTACNKTASVASNQSAAPTPSPSPDQFAATRLTYAKHCAVCHAETGEGKTAEFEGKKIKAPSLRSGHALNHPDSDFVKQINKGGDGMPAFANKLTAKEIDEMVRFIREDFQGGHRPSGSPMGRTD